MHTLTQQLTRGILHLSIAALLLSALACVVGPKYHPPVNQAPAAVYKESPAQHPDSQGWNVAQPADAKLRGKWWEIFNDSELNALEEQLNIDNQNIKQYFENFMEARAVVREARAQYSRLCPSPPASLTLALPPTWVPPLPLPRAQVPQRQQPPSNLPVLSIRCPSKLPGSPIFGAKSATLYGRRSTPRRSAPPIWRTNASPNRPASRNIFLKSAGRMKLQKIFNDTVDADQKALDLTRALYESGIDDEISVVEAQTTLQSAQAAATNVARRTSAV